MTLSRGKSAEIGSNLRRKMLNEDHGHLQVHGLCILGTYEMNIDYINTLYLNIDLSYIDLLCFFETESLNSIAFIAAKSSLPAGNTSNRLGLLKVLRNPKRAIHSKKRVMQ